MKNNILRFAICIILCINALTKSFAQSQEAQQLLLNVEKLSQLRNILTDMKKGYMVISSGYNTIKDISKGNFSIHEVFLDGLLKVSPEVKKYRKVVEIISLQKGIVSDAKTAFSKFNSTDFFSVREIDLLAKVYAGVLQRSLEGLDELSMILTSSTLRMSDDERLQAIDRIFEETSDKADFLRDFNNKNLLLLNQRKLAVKEITTERNLFKTN